MTEQTLTEQTFRVTGMDCASCATNIEKAVGKLDGVELSSINFTTELLRVNGRVDPTTIITRVRDLGYDVRDIADVANPDAPTTDNRPPTTEKTGVLPYLWQRWDTRLALLGALLVLPGVVFHELLPGLGEHLFGSYGWLIDVASVGAMVTAGWPIAKSAWQSLRINRDININVLMTIAAIGAVIIGAYTEAGLVMVLFAIGEALEGYTASRARDSIRSLMAVAPNEATVLRPCIDCAGHLGQDGYTGGPCPFCGLEEHRVPVDDLLVGETIVVKPGERIPMDGRILSGISSVNQAPITGESALIDKAAGDKVFASAINGEGTLEIEVTHRAADNTIARLIQMVEEAQEKRAPAQRFVDRFARVYTPAVVVLAVLVATIPPLFFGQPFLNPNPDTFGWLYRALALLVVACPCALVISTPVSIVSAIANAAKHGVLFKGGAHLEELSRVNAIAFDKTGTLTKGEPTVVAVQAIQCKNGLNRRERGERRENNKSAESAVHPCPDCDDLLALASAVEQRSEHPLAQAVVAAADARGLRQRYPAAQQVQAQTGRGVVGEVNGRAITIGSHRSFSDHEAHAVHCAALEQASASGHTTMLIRDDDAYLGYIAVADTIRADSRAAVAELKQMGLRHLVMLTGDNAATAQKVAADVGVTDVRADLLPEDKVTAVSQLRTDLGTVAMIGDGINDTPALATANVGIAIGNTGQAMETADITLMGGDLRQLPNALRLSRATMRTIRANVALSLGIKGVFLIAVLLGVGTMWMAVLADMGTSLLVTLNGMRLLKRPFTPSQ